MTSILLSALLIVAPPECGKYVVGSHQSVLPLKDKQSGVVKELRAHSRKLAEPLPVTRCGTLVVIVTYQGRLYAIDRWRILFEQEFAFECRERLAGDIEQKVKARTLNAFDRIVCLPLLDRKAPIKIEGR